MGDWDDDPQPDETDLLSDFVAIHAATTSEQLWRALTLPAIRSGLHPLEAVGLFRHLHEHGEPDALETALMLCTCGRWEPYTGRLIVGLIATAILSERDVDELVACFLWSDRYRFTYPAKWFGAQELVIDLDEQGQPGESRVIRLDPDTPVPVDRRIAPPLRRWAAATAVRRNPILFDKTQARARSLGGQDGAAIILGVLDAIEALETSTARRAIALRAGLAARIGTAPCSRSSGCDRSRGRETPCGQRSRQEGASLDRSAPSSSRGVPRSEHSTRHKQETRRGSRRRTGRAVSRWVSLLGSRLPCR
jgi:hypothetical protein